MKLKQGDRVEVLWIDAFDGGQQWKDEEELDSEVDKQNPVKTTGYFVKNYKHFYIISLCDSNNVPDWKRWGAYMGIPIKTITSIKRLK